MSPVLSRSHLESETEKFFVKRIRMVGGYAMKFVPVVAGMPDRIVFMPGGRTFLVELKQEGKKPHAVQVVWFDRFDGIGHPVVVLDSKQACVDWIREVVETTPPVRRKPGPKPKA